MGLLCFGFVQTGERPAAGGAGDRARHHAGRAQLQCVASTFLAALAVVTAWRSYSSGSYLGSEKWNRELAEIEQRAVPYVVSSCVAGGVNTCSDEIDGGLIHGALEFHELKVGPGVRLLPGAYGVGKALPSKAPEKSHFYLRKR